MYADTLMNFRISEHSSDIAEVKKVLISLIGETHSALELLTTRCNKVKEIVEIF
jgi:hypothetical protein